MLQQDLANAALVKSYTPDSHWENGNGRVFGAWTMYHAFRAALDLYAQLEDSARAEFADSSPDDFSMLETKFSAGAETGKSVLFKPSLDDEGRVHIEAADEDGQVLLQTQFVFSDAVKEYDQRDFDHVIEMMSRADMAAGENINYRYADHPNEVCVTVGIPYLNFHDVKAFETLMDGGFDLRRFETLQGGNPEQLEEGPTGDPRFYGRNFSVSENLKAVTADVGCESDGHSFVRGQMVFLNLDAQTQRPKAIDASLAESWSSYDAGAPENGQ